MAQTQEYKEYTVIKGDTLWDISNKELKDPFLWPKIWKENPEIPNPDRIYPQQVIRIPLYILQKEISDSEMSDKKAQTMPIATTEGQKKEVAAKSIPLKKEYLVEKNVLIASGYITDAVSKTGKIVSSPTGRNLLGRGDYAYIRTDRPAKKGDKFYIAHVVEPVKHPKTGLMMGHLIEILGIAEVVGMDDNEVKVEITASFSDILLTDNHLETYYEIEAPYAMENPRKPDISGYVAAAKQLKMINGTWDIVYIDKGQLDGIETGDMIETILRGEHKVINGIIQVINVRQKTATALIRKSRDVVSKGDVITKIK
jgi:hypothetical protein